MTTSNLINSNIQKMKEIKILSSNGIDQNNVIVLNPEYERNRRYYERNREKLLQYYHEYYLLNKEDILQKKKEYNKNREVKERHHNYYLTHKAKAIHDFMFG